VSHVQPLLPVSSDPQALRRLVRIDLPSGTVFSSVWLGRFSVADFYQYAPSSFRGRWAPRRPKLATLF